MYEYLFRPTYIYSLYVNVNKTDLIRLQSNWQASEISKRIHIPRNAIDSLSIIRKYDLSDGIKRDFFQAVAVTILLYGCTTWILVAHTEKTVDGNYTKNVAYCFQQIM